MAKKLKIPKSFEILGQIIKVKKRKTLISTSQDYGQMQFIPNEIHIQIKTDGIPITEDQISATFWHEAMHCVMTSIGRQDLNQDEAFIDLVGQHIHQILKSSKY